MFSLKHTLDQGDTLPIDVDVLASVTDSFGAITVRILSVQWKAPAIDTRHRDGSHFVQVELIKRLKPAAMADVDCAVRAHYQKILDRHAGHPEDWPRDGETA